jgi:hypothetical protein
VHRVERGDRHPQSRWIPHSAPQGWSVGLTTQPLHLGVRRRVISDTDAVYLYGLGSVRYNSIDCTGGYGCTTECRCTSLY